MAKSTKHCVACAADGIKREATHLAEQSADAGVTRRIVPICDGHASTWWDGADFVGKLVPVD